MLRKIALTMVVGVVVATAAQPPVQSAPLPSRATAPAAASPADVGWPPAPPSQLVIDTVGQPIDRDDYVEGTVTLDGVTRATEVRGRGNSTWTWPKKPYKLKLAEDAALVGTREYDEWVLLAGYADRSALRTAAAFAVASQTRLGWTPQFRFVEVVLNGQPQGLYMLSEQVEKGSGRVDVPDDGYLLEINRRYLRDDEPGFRTSRGTPVAFKDPDEVTRKQRRQVRRAVTAFEKVLYSPSFAHPTRGYAAHINVRKVIDWYLVEELFSNQDSNFHSSVHFSWVPGKKFVFGPVWDFDLSAGTRWRATSSPEGWLTRVGEHWVARMLEDPAFSTRVKSRWSRLRPLVEAVVAQVPDAAATLAPAAATDWQQWHAAGDLDWTHHAQTHAGEVAFLRDWLTQRVRWLSRNEVRLGARRLRTQERVRTAWVPVQLQSPPGAAVTVTYSVTGGTATPGTDFAAASGELTFAPGQVQRYIPVSILDDTEAETGETVWVRLGAASQDVVVGSPDLATVVIGANDAG